MYSVSPTDIESCHLQFLLLHIPGACSFVDLKTVDSQICQEFMKAARRRTSLHADAEYERCMTKAVLFQVPHNS